VRISGFFLSCEKVDVSCAVREIAESYAPVEEAILALLRSAYAALDEFL